MYSFIRRSSCAIVDNTTSQANHCDKLRAVSPPPPPHHSVPSCSAGDASSSAHRINPSPQPSDAIRCLPYSDDAPSHSNLMENEKLAAGALPLVWSEEARPASPEPVVVSARIDSLDSGFASA